MLQRHPGERFINADADAHTHADADADTDAHTHTHTPIGPHGYWLVGSDGGIFSLDRHQFYGSTGAMQLQRPVVGITPTADDGGYWLVASDGGIFTSATRGFTVRSPESGSPPAGSSVQEPECADRRNGPVRRRRRVLHGGCRRRVFAFGDAKFEGSCPGIGGCSGAAVAVMPDASGNGYWLVTATGHVYAFGDAVNYGAPGPQSVPVTSAVRTTDGGGILDPPLQRNGRRLW